MKILSFNPKSQSQQQKLQPAGRAASQPDHCLCRVAVVVAGRLAFYDTINAKHQHLNNPLQLQLFTTTPTDGRVLMCSVCECRNS